MSVWVRRKDKKRAFEIVAYQDAPTPPLTAELREACKHAVHVIKTNGEVLRAGRATMFILQILGVGSGLMKVLAHPPFIWFIETGYFIVARNRPFFSRFLFTKKQNDKKEKSN